MRELKIYTIHDIWIGNLCKPDFSIPDFYVSSVTLPQYTERKKYLKICIYGVKACFTHRNKLYIFLWFLSLASHIAQSSQYIFPSMCHLSFRVTHHTARDVKRKKPAKMIEANSSGCEGSSKRMLWIFPLRNDRFSRLQFINVCCTTAYAYELRSLLKWYTRIPAVCNYALRKTDVSPASVTTGRYQS